MIIRTLNAGDWAAIGEILPAAFAGFPWYENLSPVEVTRRLESMQAKRRTAGLVAEEAGVVLGTSLWDTPMILELESERGEALARFAAERMSTGGRSPKLVWERELLVHPNYQGRSIGTALRMEFINRLAREGNFLVLTRMRDDNLPTIRIAEKMGFSRTGIRVESSQKAGVFHEYWYLKVPHGNY